MSSLLSRKNMGKLDAQAQPEYNGGFREMEIIDTPANYPQIPANFDRTTKVGVGDPVNSHPCGRVDGGLPARLQSSVLRRIHHRGVDGCSSREKRPSGKWCGREWSGI